jgi:hypothetical protein
MHEQIHCDWKKINENSFSHSKLVLINTQCKIGGGKENLKEAQSNACRKNVSSFKYLYSFYLSSKPHHVYLKTPIRKRDHGLSVDWSLHSL